MPQQTTRQGGGTVHAMVMARVSTAEQARDDKTSLEDQIAKGTAEVAKRSWVLHDTATDVFTGASSDRPELAKIMAVARASAIQAVVFTKVDRLARNLRDLLNIEAELARLGVAIVATDQPIDTSTPVGRMTFQQLGAFAEFERTIIRDRTVVGQRAKASKGGWPGGTPPYGFRVVGKKETAKLEHDPGEVEVIERAVALLVNERKTLAECADQLNAYGFCPRKAPRWDVTRLRWVLSNPALAGTVVFAKPVRPAKPDRSRGGRRPRHPRPGHIRRGPAGPCRDQHRDPVAEPRLHAQRTACGPMRAGLPGLVAGRPQLPGIPLRHVRQGLPLPDPPRRRDRTAGVGRDRPGVAGAGAGHRTRPPMERTGPPWSDRHGPARPPHREASECPGTRLHGRPDQWPGPGRVEGGDGQHRGRPGDPPAGTGYPPSRPGRRGGGPAAAGRVAGAGSQDGDHVRGGPRPAGPSPRRPRPSR